MCDRDERERGRTGFMGERGRTGLNLAEVNAERLSTFLENCSCDLGN